MLLYFIDDTCFPEHDRIHRRRQLRLQVNHAASTLKVTIFVSRARYGTLNSNQCEECGCVMEL